ncbi:hypothetical protein JB92DRAFT_2711560, partial [Gautieria morchelliformis]
KQDIILRFPWLQEHNPEINWHPTKPDSSNSTQSASCHPLSCPVNATAVDGVVFWNPSRLWC